MYSKFAVVACILAALLFGGTIVGQDFNNPDCSIETFSMSPNSSVVSQGTHVQLFGRGSCSGGVRAVRFEVFGIPKAEIGSSQQSETFKTEEFSPGRGLVCFAVAGGNNSSWLAAERRCVTITIEARSGNTSGSEANSGPGSSSGNNSPQSSGNSSSSSGSSSSTFGGDMNIWGWCQSVGHAGSDYSGDAYSWYCFNADGSYARGIDVDAVCRFSSNGSHPYAGLRNASDAYSWFCATSPQGRPQSSGNTGSGNSSNSNSGSGSSGSNSSGNSGNSSSNSACYMPVGVGDGARVTPGEPNNRRAGPGTSYRQTGSLPGSTQFTVTDTACANGYGWVQVDGSGWTATGTASDPWVERWNTSSTTSQTSVEDYVVVHVSGYALRVNPRTCAIQNGAEIIQGEISFFSFQLQNSRNIEEIINSIFDYFELDTGRSDLLRVEIKDSIKAIVPKCSSPYYLIGNLYMDLSGVGNVVFGYFMGMFDSSAGEVISALKQGERDGFGRQWHWFETWIDYPDDRNQRNMGSILARQVSDASQITIDMIIRAAITADLR